MTLPTNTNLSASEVEALCAKAARGAGMDWGMAEEAGRAAKWLYQSGLNGPEALLHLLERMAHLGQLAIAGSDLHSIKGGDLSPITVGTALSDFERLHADPCQIAQVFSPVLVLPFVHQIAQATDRTLELEWRQGKLFVHPQGSCSGMMRQLEHTRAARLALGPTGGISAPTHPIANRPVLKTQTIQRLDGFAMRTTVPATAASRANAGAGTSDND